LRTRLIALDMLLSGQPIEAAVDAARVRPDTVERWYRRVIRDGITPTLEKWASPPPRTLKVNADPLTLRELADRELNSRVRKRLLALALVAEGMSAHDASLRIGIAYSVLLKRIKRFRQEGMAAIQDAPSRGSTKLTNAQLEDLRRLAVGRPDMTVEALCECVRSRFGVRYSISGLQALLKREFGIVRAARPAPPPRASAGIRRARSARCSPVHSVPGRRSPPARTR
jgi:transposase